MRTLLGAVLLLAACGEDVLVPVPDPPPERERTRRDDPPPPPPTTSGDECRTNADCGPNAECESGTCVGVGVLQVTLRFTVDSDYDLHLLLPSGNEIYWANKSTEGGVLDVDQCIEPCGFGTHVENIFFNQAAPQGPYVAWVENFNGRDGGPFTIEVSGAATATMNGSLFAFAGDFSDDLEFFVP